MWAVVLDAPACRIGITSAPDGAASVRFIYTDEAGTSAPEPVTVVVGLIVHADTQWMPAARMIEEALAKVPQQYRDGFTFHATSVWGNRKYRDGWDVEERLALLHEMMSIPYRSGMAIAFGIFYRNSDISRDLGGMTPEQYHHTEAFGHCMACADQYIRDYAGPSEVATVVAEDIPEMRNRLRATVSALRRMTKTYSNATIRQLEQMSSPTSTSATMKLHVSRIVDDIHFTPKTDAPILQVADAVAFGLRRYYSGQTNGLEFARTIIHSTVGPPQRGGDGECGYIFRDKMKQTANPFSGV